MSVLDNLSSIWPAGTRYRSSQGALLQPERNGSTRPLSGSNFCRTTQPMSLANRCKLTEGSDEIVRTR